MKSSRRQLQAEAEDEALFHERVDVLGMIGDYGDPSRDEDMSLEEQDVRD